MKYVCVGGAVVFEVGVGVAVVFDFDLRGPHLNPPENLAENGSEKFLFEPQASSNFSHFQTNLSGFRI